MQRFLATLMALVCLAAAAQALEAGAAKVEITPPLGTPLNGYQDRWGRGAIDVHDPVWVRSLYLNDGNTGVFLVSADLCVINRELRDRVLELAPDVVPRENIILTATHNHSAQGAMVKDLIFRSITGRFMPEVLESTAQRFAESMRTAYANRRRAAIGHGTFTQTDLTRNRRFDDGPIDEQVGIIRVEDSDGAPIAILTNMAAHPTTVGGEYVLSVSADYPGYYYTELERLAAPGCVAMFINGAEGNQRCGNPRDLEGMERTASIGRILAQRVFEAAAEVPCGEAPLRYARSTPTLPLSLAASFLPEDTTLSVLEIGDLALTFFPGEPCVEIGLELREQAMAAGYGNQFTVALSNDHLMYFVPRSLYHTLTYENAMHFYGPSMEAWFYREFSTLLSKMTPPPAPTAPEAAPLAQFDGGDYLLVSGTPYAVGHQQGEALRGVFQDAFHRFVTQPVADGTLVPEDGLWRFIPGWMDPVPLALPRLGLGARPMLTGVAPATFDLLEGIADGAGMPFDAAWLLESVQALEASETETLYRISSYCTVIAAVGDRAGADDLLVGRNLDWPTREDTLVLEVRPDSGRSYIQAGLPWLPGAFSGMNDAGVVLCAERRSDLGEPSPNGPPADMVLRELLQQSGDYQTALAGLHAASHLRGYSILLAAWQQEASEATVIEYGDTIQTREPSEGLLLGTVPPEAPPADAVLSPAEQRYARAVALLADERIIALEELQGVLCDQNPEATGRARILNQDTLHSVVFVPRTREVHVTPIREDGTPAPPVVYRLLATQAPASDEVAAEAVAGDAS